MKFSIETLDWLADLEPQEGWSTAGVSEIQGFLDGLEGYSPEELKAINQPWQDFLTFYSHIEVARDPEVEASDEVLVLFVQDGLLERVQGPTVYADNDLLILKVGDNIYSADIKDGKLSVGPLKGAIKVEQITDSQGKPLTTQDGFPVLGATASLRKPKESTIYEVGLSLDLKRDLDVGILTAAIEDEGVAGILPFLRSAPSGGGFTDMRLLPPGEYLCTNIEFAGKHEEYGNSWRIHLDGIGPVMSRGKTIERALGGDAATEITGKWLRLAAAARKNGGITFNLASHEVKLGDRNVSYLEWASNPDLFNAEVDHYLKGGFFTQRQPHAQALPKAEVVTEMMSRRLPSDKRGPDTSALPPVSVNVETLKSAAPAAEAPQVVGASVTAEIPF